MTGTTAIGSAPSTSAASHAEQRAQLAAAAKQFEAIFVRQMMGEMREAKLADDDLTSSSATDTFQGLADAQTADSMAEKGGLGIAAMLLRQLDRAQGAAPMQAAPQDKGA